MSTKRKPKLDKKVYFIKKPQPGHELTTLLKNKFKSIDAIRDILSWHGKGKNFHVTLTDWATGLDEEPSRTIAIGPSLPPLHNHRNITTIIGNIIAWLDSGRDFDIILHPTDQFQLNLN
jgi:hypothetical protein